MCLRNNAHMSSATLPVLRPHQPWHDFTLVHVHELESLWHSKHVHYTLFHVIIHALFNGVDAGRTTPKVHLNCIILFWEINTQIECLRKTHMTNKSESQN